jgi:hypothetical protein
MADEKPSIITSPNDTLFVPRQLSEAEEKYTRYILEQIKNLNENKIPRNHKGDEEENLKFTIEEYYLLNNLLDSLMNNDTYKGSLTIKSSKFDDRLGFKISKIIEKDNLIYIKIDNQTKPFSDKIGIKIGNALKYNNNLKSLNIFLNIEEYSPDHLVQFLVNENSSLENISFLKLNKKFFEIFAKYMNKDSKLKNIGFYFEPLEFHDLLYGK